MTTCMETFSKSSGCDLAVSLVVSNHQYTQFFLLISSFFGPFIAAAARKFRFLVAACGDVVPEQKEQAFFTTSLGR